MWNHQHQLAVIKQNKFWFFYTLDFSHPFIKWQVYNLLRFTKIDFFTNQKRQKLKNEMPSSFFKVGIHTHAMFIFVWPYKVLHLFDSYYLAKKLKLCLLEFWHLVANQVSQLLQSRNICIEVLININSQLFYMNIKIAIF